MPYTTTACRACGATLTGDGRVCPQCGTDQGLATATPVAATPAFEDDGPWSGVGRRLRDALVGEFEVFGLLGHGGMAAVFLAHEHALNRKVALKVMSPSLMMGDGMVERFRQEAVTQANLQHANIVAMHGVRAVDDLQFFVMQFIAGRTLQQAVRAERDAGRQLSFPVIRSILYQTGSALAYAHRKGVIHRDVKPGNILLNSDGDAVVTDFGIAKVTEAPGLTMTGAVVGTPAYMSPEQCFAGELTPSSDQYSLGIVAWELLTGKPPFEGTSFVVMQAHTTQALPPLRELRPDCPQEFESALELMLAKYPDDRFPDLMEALHGLGATPPSLRADDPVRAELRRLADVAAVEAKLSSLLVSPQSPIPVGKRTTAPVRTSAPATLISGGRAATIPPQAAATSESAPTPIAVATPAPAATPSRNRNLLLGGVALVATAAVVFVLLRDKPEPAQPPAPTPAATTSVPSAEPAQPVQVPEPETPPETTVAAAPPRLAISGPRSAALVVGDRSRLQARADASLESQPLRWSSRSPRVASVDARSGEVTALAPGRAIVVATRGSGSDSVVVSVSAPSPAATPGQQTPAVVSPPVAPAESRPAPELPTQKQVQPERKDEPRPTPAPVAPPPAAEVDAETLLAAARSTIARYASSVSTKDTAAIRRTFPTAGPQVMTRWQSMFEAADRVRLTVSDAQAADDFPPAVGGTARFRVKQQITFALKGGREQSNASDFVAILRRDGNGWTIVSVSDR